MVSGLCKLPINLVFASMMLWWNFGVSFLISLIPFVMSFTINNFLSRRRKVMQKERSRLSDKKSNVLNEVLTNAKMLKLYGWLDFFKQKIIATREEEKTQMNQIVFHDSVKQAINHMLPSLIPIVCFATYVGLGNSINLG